MGKKWYFLIFSLVITVAGLGSMFVHAGSLKFWQGIPVGVDFKGGTIVNVRFKEAVHEDEIRGAISKAGVKDARIQRYGPAVNNEFMIAMEQAANENALDAGKQTIIRALNQSLLAGKYELRNVDIVGPQVGEQLRNTAIEATLFSLAGMLIYLWFRFELIYGAAAVAAVFHDTL